VRSLDPRELDRRQRNNLINGLIYPRPIAWVSTVASDGTRNLAPFSFFNAFSFNPPTVGVSPGSRRGIPKDTLANVRATGEFVINLVSASLADAANASSAELASEVDEWNVVGVTAAASETVAPARVAQAPAALECQVHQIIELGADEPSNSLVIGRVLRIHVLDDALDEQYLPRPETLDLVGRMGGDLWTGTRQQFLLPRPSDEQPWPTPKPAPRAAASWSRGTPRATAGRSGGPRRSA
jgi:flavin reductase (DIM6/NTAB) family NADH-FMN oxidoreductase RutF